MRDLEEQAVIAAVRRGDRECFRILVERHHDTLYGVLMRLLGDPALADELAQEAFVRAYAGLDGFRADARFSTWLVQIGIHLARDEVRRRQRRRQPVSLDERCEARGPGREPVYEGAEADPLAALCLRENEQLLLAALRRLPLPYREVLTLRYYGDWSFAEIAASTGDSVGTLKVRAHRARTMLRDELAARDPGFAAEAGAAGAARRVHEARR
ncbi:MAG: sigma-70 family RNA polymerase sigma factor [Candidatus Krumholzibacteriia bacterium]